MHWKLTLARAISLRSELHHRARRPPEALADARRAVKLVDPAVVEGSGNLYELGAFQAAYRARACELNLAAKATDLPEERDCLDTLNKAIAAGFDDENRLRTDPRLKLLRERQNGEFERLVAAAATASQTANSNEVPKSENR